MRQTELFTRHKYIDILPKAQVRLLQGERMNKSIAASSFLPAADAALVPIDIDRCDYRRAIKSLLEHCSSNSELALRSLLLVGARPGPKTWWFGRQKPLKRSDMAYLWSFLSTCKEIGVPLHPQIKITRCNLEEGSDFLKLMTPFDAVLFSYLFHGKVENLRDEKASSNPFYTQSPHHNEAGIWHRRLCESQAKLVGNIRNQNSMWELPNDFIGKAPFTCLGSRTALFFQQRNIFMFADTRWADRVWPEPAPAAGGVSSPTCNS